jgi:hypothetical protein
MKKVVAIHHDNGYTGIMYGESSLVVKDTATGREIFHTGFRNINTEAELMDFLDSFPEFLELLDGIGEAKKRGELNDGY